MYNNLNKLLKLFFIMLDIGLLVISYLIAHSLRGIPLEQTYHDKVIVLYSIIGWILISGILNFYKHNIDAKIKSFIKVMLFYLGVLAILGFFFKEARYSRLIFAYFTIIYGLLLFISHRIILRFVKFFQQRRYLSRNAIIVGNGWNARKINEELKTHPEYGRHILGYIKNNDDHYKLDSILLGDFHELENIFNNLYINEIFIALNMNDLAKISWILDLADKHGIRTYFIPDIFQITQRKFAFSYIGSLPVYHLRDVPLDKISSRVVKRAFDIMFSTVILLLLSPILLLVSITIKLTSKGPVLFIQKRTGYNNKEFKLLKFRSMRVVPRDVADSLQASEDDPRKTKFGNFIRSTNIDELPQFINVLMGNMSVVGPRPHMISHTRDFRNRIKNYMIRHYVKPGITGLAQVNGWRGPTDTNEKIQKRVEFDIQYIENWTFWLDIKIILRTIFSKQSRLNAY